MLYFSIIPLFIALNFQAELLLTGSCCAALWLNLKSPCSAWYLWNVGTLDTSSGQLILLSSSYCPISLGDRREIGHMMMDPGKSQVAGAEPSFGGTTPAHHMFILQAKRSWGLSW